MLILGVDPGTATIGFGYVEIAPGLPPSAVSYGVIQTDKAQPMAERLLTIHEDLTTLLGELRPDVVAIEDLFFLHNVSTGISVAQARGVILLACAQAGVPVASYSPAQIKQTITGHGKAQKREVQEAIRDLLNLESIPKPDDAADALSIAMTHFQQLEGRGELPRQLRSGGRG